MPSGASKFEKHASIITARRSSGEFQPISYFSIKDGETARVRFLEQGDELTWAISHRVKTPGLQYPQDVLCLDQEDDGTSCPACQSDIKEVRSRSTKGYVNLIWRGNEDEGITRAPVYKTNDKGFVEKSPQGQKIVTGFEDSVWMWKCSKTVFEQILSKDPKYKGLMSRDFVVSRKGAGLENTMYAIEPAVIDGGVEGMTIADANLASKKFDVVSLTTPGAYDEMVALLNGQNSAGNNLPGSTFQREPTQNEVFSSPMRSSAFQR
jgi:hypothetical protein